MSDHQTVTFQDALDVVESLPEDQQENLTDSIRRRLIERKREVLADHIKEASDEYQRGEVRRGTADDLMKEIADFENLLQL